MAGQKVFKIVILGPPGSGKSTQAEKLADNLKIAYIATGQLFRHMSEANTDEGRAIKAYLDQGEILPDELTADLVKSLLDKDEYENGYVGEGFPRTLNQAKMLETEISQAIYLNISDETAITRLLSRQICSKCKDTYNLITEPPKMAGICDKCGGKLTQRDDDNKLTVKNRLQVYHQQTEPVLQYFKQRNILFEIDGEKPVGIIEQSIYQHVSEKND